MSLVDFILMALGVSSFFIVRKTCDPLNFFNPFVYFYWTYFIFCFIAVLYRDIYSYALDISEQTIWLITLGLMFFSIGGFFANHSKSKARTRIAIQYLINNAAKSISTERLLLVIMILTPVLFAIIFIAQTGKILWFSDSFDDERIVIRQGSGWLAILGISSAYVATIYSGIHFYKKDKFLKLFFVTLVLAVSAISYGNRAQGLEVIIIGFIFIWIGKFKSIKMLHFLLGIFGALILVMSLGVVRQGLDFNIETIYKQILWRPFTNIQNTEWILSFIPNVHDYFYGESLLIDFLVLLPGYQPNFGTYMKDLMGKDFSGGSITVSFLGQAYADFGFVLSLVLIFIAGFVFQRLFIYLSKNGQWLPFLIVVSISAKSMASSGIVAPLIYVFIPCCIFLAMWMSMKSIFRVGGFSN